MQPVQKKTTLALCLIVSLALITPTNARAITPTQVGLTAASLALAVSIYKHLQTLPVDRKNEYDTPEFNNAVKELKKGKNIKKNLATISNYSYELWSDGFCGHAIKIGSPRFNEKTGLHEIPYIESRGVLGWVSDRIEPVKKTAMFATEAAITIGGVAVGITAWKAFVMGNTQARKVMDDFYASLCSKNPILCLTKTNEPAANVAQPAVVVVVQEPVKLVI